MDELKHESNFFNKLPDEVLQLIFEAIRDCRSLIHCMAVSKAFKNYASKISALKITCPCQFSTYNQKLWKIYSMVKTFKALESLIVHIGQPKNEPLTSWAHCMRYAEIGTAVEKFVFMAAKLGDFVEFDFSLGLRSQLTNENIKNIDNECISKNEDEFTSFQRVNKHKNDHRLLVNEEIAFHAKEYDGGETSNTNMNAHLSTSRKEPSMLKNRNLKPSELGLYPIKSKKSLVANNTPLTFQFNNKEKSNITPPCENQLQYGKGESSERFDAHDCIEDQVSLHEKTFDFPKQPHQQNVSTPIIDLHLKQVIAPSNNVLKRMVPVIVFAIVQGLDEFRDMIPNFIEKFVKLKRFVFVDIVDSITIYMREHQIQQVRTLRLETLSKLISESVVFKNDLTSTKKNDKFAIDGIKFVNRNENKLEKDNQSNEDESKHENKQLDININEKDLNKIGEIKNTPLKLQIHEIKIESSSCNVDNKSSMFDTKLKEETENITRNVVDELQTTSRVSNQIIKPLKSSNICDVCQDCKIKGNSGICWHHFPNGLSSLSTSLGNYANKSPLNYKMETLPHFKQLVENWSCNDPSLRKWLKGKQTLVGQEDASIHLQTNTKQIELSSTKNKIPKNVSSFEEIMACQLRNELSRQLSNTPTVTNFKKINDLTLNKTSSNSHVIFLNNENHYNIKRNNSQTSIGPTTSIMKEPNNFKNINMLKESIEDFENIHEFTKENLELNLWKKPLHIQEDSRTSSISLSNSISKYSSSNFELHKIPFHQIKLNERKNTPSKKIRCLNDFHTNSKSQKLKCKTINKKYVNMKDTNSKFFGKYSFKRRLQTDASRRQKGDRAFRIANSRKCSRNSQPRNLVWMEGSRSKKGKEDIVIFVQDGKEKYRDALNFSKKSKCIENENDDDTTSNSNTNGKENSEDIRRKMVVEESSSNEKTTISNKIPLQINNEFSNIQENNIIEDANINNLTSVTTIFENEQFSHNTSNNEHFNSKYFQGVGLIPNESNATLINDPLQGLCELEDTNMQILNNPRTKYTPSLSPIDNDIHHTKVTRLGVKTRERSATRKLGHRARKTRSLRRENHAHGEREREARREQRQEGMHKHEHDIEQEAFFFDISFWRADQVATSNYILSEVSMCIATHDAKPLSNEELKMLSTNALAGPLLIATIAYVNDQIRSHNL